MKVIYTTALILIMGVGLLMVGCGPTPLEPTEENLTGVWNSGCSPSGDFFVDITWTFDPPDLTASADYYLSVGCPAGFFLFNLSTTSETTLTGESIVNSQDETVWGIDHVIDDIILTPAAISVDTMNGVAQCEIDDWVADVGRSVLGNICDGNQTPENGDLLEEVLQLLDETKLRLGLAGEVGGAREEELDTIRTYTKQ